jgi:hypothetical protein
MKRHGIPIVAVFLFSLSAGMAAATPIDVGTGYWFQWGGDGIACSGTMSTSSPVPPPSTYGVHWPVTAAGRRMS